MSDLNKKNKKQNKNDNNLEKLDSQRELEMSIKQVLKKKRISVVNHLSQKKIKY